MEKYDVIIIGCGTSGAAIAYELAKYKLRVCVLEKENDVAMGTTRANSGILHAGYDPHPGTLMARLNVRGVEIAKELAETMRFAYEPVGSLVLAFNGADLEMIKTLKERGDANGVKGCKILSKEEVQKIEPLVSEDVVAALYAPSAICSPWEFCLCMAETAVMNGVDLLLEHEVVEITRQGGKGLSCKDCGEQASNCKDNDECDTSKFNDFGDCDWKVVAAKSKNPLQKADTNDRNSTDLIELVARFVINASGLSAEKIHDLAAPHSFDIKFDRGEYYLLDKSEGFRARHTIFQCPDEKGKGVLVSPTVHGNLLVGPNSERIESNDYSTTSNGLSYIKNASAKSVPSVDFRNNIRNFAGIRARSSNPDFIIEEAEGAPGFIDVAGICSPGLSSAPAIGEYVAELLQNAGLELEKKTEPLKIYQEPKHFKQMTPEERNEKIAENPAYGRIVCRCESITEGEMIETFDTPIPPRSVGAIKRRTMAGLGRCQGGFCGPQVVKILAENLGLSEDKILQNEDGSWMLIKREVEDANQ